MDEKFETSRFYTKQEIQHICQGGNPGASIGVIRKKVLFLCIDPEVNPSFLLGSQAYGLDKNKKAYIVGNGPNILKNAEIMMNYRENFPVFVKSSNGNWKYLGLFKSSGFSFKQDEIAKYEVNAKNLTDKNQAIVFLTDVTNHGEASGQSIDSFEIKKAA